MRSNAARLAPHLVPRGSHIAEWAEEVDEVRLRLVLRLLVPHRGAQRQCTTGAGLVSCCRREAGCIVCQLLRMAAMWLRRQGQPWPRRSAQRRLRRRQHAARQKMLGQQQAGGPVPD